MDSKKRWKSSIAVCWDLIVKNTKSKKDDELWKKIKPLIKKFK